MFWQIHLLSIPEVLRMTGLLVEHSLVFATVLRSHVPHYASLVFDLYP